MIFEYNKKQYKIEIIKKNNKNTYIRVRNNTIIVTTNYFVSKNKILKLIEENRTTIIKMITTEEKRIQKEEKFMIFGKQYEIIYDTSYKKLTIKDEKIIVPNQQILIKWLNKFIEDSFYCHLIRWKLEFGTQVPSPKLIIRKMKTRWGVCNRKTCSITLNLDLFKYDYECLDYVIIHEFSHFLVPNHSKEFWSVVEKYCPNYKEIRKKLRG